MVYILGCSKLVLLIDMFRDSLNICFGHVCVGLFLDVLRRWGILGTCLWIRMLWLVILGLLLGFTRMLLDLLFGVEILGMRIVDLLLSI